MRWHFDKLHWALIDMEIAVSLYERRTISMFPCLVNYQLSCSETDKYHRIILRKLDEDEEGVKTSRNVKFDSIVFLLIYLTTGV